MRPEYSPEFSPKGDGESPRAYIDLMSSVEGLASRIAVEHKPNFSEHELQFSPLDVPHTTLAVPDILKDIGGGAIDSVHLMLNRTRNSSQPSTSINVGFNYSDESNVSLVVDAGTLQADMLVARYSDASHDKESQVQVPRADVLNFIISLGYPLKNGAYITEEKLQEIDPTFALNEEFIDPLIDDLKDHAMFSRDLLRFVIPGALPHRDGTLQTAVQIERVDGIDTSLSIEDEVYKAFGVTEAGEFYDRVEEKVLHLSFEQSPAGLQCDVDFYSREGHVLQSTPASAIDSSEKSGFFNHFVWLIEALQHQYDYRGDIPTDPRELDS